MKILIVEDDHATASHIAAGILPHVDDADIARDGTRGWSMATANHYDLLVVDRMLPGMDGLELVHALRREGHAVPVLMISALDAVEARVEGLASGADDYLPKPFAMVELCARITALYRRWRGDSAPTTLRVGNLEIELLERRATRAGQLLNLQPREFQLLQCLMSHAGQVVTRTMLLERVWDFHFDPQTSVVETHISRLRTKIDRGFGETLLHTVRGVGYCLRASA